MLVRAITADDDLALLEKLLTDEGFEALVSEPIHTQFIKRLEM
jgi:hypothetical protein